MPTSLTRLSRFAGVGVCLVLVGYVGYLVVSQYRSHLALQESRFRQLAQDVEMRSLAVRYFLSEREDDLLHLAESREIPIYFENEALGRKAQVIENRRQRSFKACGCKAAT